MKLPNGERAFVDMRKLVDYCLDPVHPRGRHKARVFRSALGFSVENAEDLRQALLRCAATGDAALTEEDEFGQRYVIDYGAQGPAGTADVRTVWMVRSGEDFPRLVTCYVL